MPRQRTQNSRYSFAPQLLSIFLTWSLLLPPAPAAVRLAFPATPPAALPLRAYAEAPAPARVPDPPAPVPQGNASRKADLVCPNQIPMWEMQDPVRNKDADSWGDITIAQPKIWQFERVSALLDGLLRDVEGVSLADLTQLDPSAQNAAAVKFIQSALEVGVQYDQAAAVTNSINRGNFQLQHDAQLQRFQADNAYVDLLVQQRNIETAQLLAAENTVNALQPLADAKTITPQQQMELDVANARVKSLTTSLGTINDSIGKASLSSLASAPTLQNTVVGKPASGSDMSSTMSGFADVLKNLPQGVQNNLTSSLGSPSLPATKRLDNFITLLYERLSREISVLQDDLARNPDNVAYFLQFDVGLYPSKKAKDHTARVEFQIDCPGCKVYSIYPGQSSYNIGNFYGSSKRNSFWGNVLTLLGLGVSASYRRQQDVLQGSLVQSVYTAGFQDGVLPNDDPKEHWIHDSSRAIQRFGWYYGSAPFEQTVTPGIRSTFALVTVPRDSIEQARDIFGNSNGCLPFHMNAAWAKRDNPLYQHTSVSPVAEVARVFPGYLAYVPNDELLAKSVPKNANPPTEPRPGDTVFASTVLRKSTSVKLPGALEDLSLVTRREKDKLHVVRMEYNTVYEAPPPPPASLPMVPTITTPSAATAGNATSSVQVATNAALTPDPLAPCSPKQCAGMLLRFDRPIDPNLVITVRGKPLKRVRDWRGRATSVLPPAQSGSDLGAQFNGSTAGTVGSLFLKQLKSDRSLLEADQLGPNTWFALNSIELYLNVSLDVAEDDEFPVIQIADPSGTLVIPHDLRKNSTELIINGLRVKPQSQSSIERDLLRNYASESAAAAFSIDRKTGCPNLKFSMSIYFHCPPTKEELQRIEAIGLPENEAPVTSGPYPFSTYLPLFLPDPAAHRIYARLGESKDDLLIGFLPTQEGEPDGAKSRHLSWRESHTQVILEDRDLDFAWSLSCFVQGDELACHLPRASILEVYRGYAAICPISDFCPAAQDSAKPLQRSFFDFLKTSSDPSGKKEFNELTTSSRNEFKQLQSVEDFLTVIRLVRSLLGTTAEFTKNLQDTYISTLQVWVIQADPDDKDVFYTPEPARIDFFPLSDNYWAFGPFKSWHFARADSDNVTVESCNFFPGQLNEKHTVTLLGSAFSSIPQILTLPWKKPNDTNCREFKIPTIGLIKGQTVFTLSLARQPGTDLPVDPSSNSPSISATNSRRDYPPGSVVNPLYPKSMLLPAYLVKPRFSNPVSTPEVKRVTSAADVNPFQIQGWDVEIPASHTTCVDYVELPDDLMKAGATADWMEGDRILSICPSGRGEDCCTAEADEWQDIDQAGRIHLQLKIPREALQYLPEELSVIRRTSKGIKFAVATLPNLRRLLLPSRLSLESLGTTQFALRGENALVIDAVAMQNGITASTIPAASGFGFALVTLPAQSSSTPSKDSTTTGSGAGTDNSVNIIVTPSPTTPPKISLSTQSTTTSAKPTAPTDQGSTTQSSSDKAATPKPLPAGTYAVIPLMQIHIPEYQTSLAKKKEADAAVKTDQDELKKATDAQKATDASKTATQAQKDAKKADVTGATAKLSQDQKTADAATKNVAAIYMPLEVTDQKGKPLVFTVPEPPKKADAPATATTPACAVPCAVLPCTAATCPPATTKTATTP